MSLVPDIEGVLARARGCLLALACGDALGGPVEFMGAGEIRARYGQVRDFMGDGVFSLRPGEWTDDTAMMLELARSLVELPEFDPEDVARRWVAWMQGQPKDIGNTTREALELIAEGVPWYEAGDLVNQKAESSGGAVGNDGIMRCAPIALRYLYDLDSLTEASMESSAITHAHPVCQWAAAALNLVIASFITGRTEAADELSNLPNEEVRSCVMSAADLERTQLRDTGHVLDTLESALWFLRHTDSLEEAIVQAASFGGDADTRAAVTGALAGALYGERAIPARWLDRLESRDEIADLATRLAMKAVEEAGA